MLKRLKRSDEHQQDQSEEYMIKKGINRCNSLDADAQQAQSNTCIGNESMTKEYSSTATYKCGR